MKATHIYIILWGLLALASCQSKEPPAESQEEVIFHLSGVVDNQILNVDAGKNDFYLSTGYQLDSQNVYEFIGNFKQTCANCKQSLKLVIRNYRVTSGLNDYSPDQAFYNGDYSYSYEGISPRSYRVTFSPQTGGNMPVSHLWDFGDGTTSILANPVKNFKANGNYLATYTATFAGGCSSSLSAMVNLSPAVTGMNNIDFGYTYMNNRQVKLFADSSFGNMAWYDGQTLLATGTSATIQLDSGFRKICLKKIVANDTVEVCKNIPSQNYLLCNVNFTRFAAPVIDPFDLSGVTVEWTDASGTVFSSKKVRQAANQHFRVVSSSDYMINEAGQKTRKLSVEFDCLLSDGVRTVSVKNMRGTIAVARP